LRKKLSPVTYVSAEAPPFLIVHDASDRAVPVAQGDILFEALKDAGGKNVNYLRFDQGFGHGVFMRNLAVTGPAREQFFDSVLKEDAAPRSNRQRSN
jgi:dipeptidyl aminopeptidase/acylaminoacyl peptidase